MGHADLVHEKVVYLPGGRQAGRALGIGDLGQRVAGRGGRLGLDLAAGEFSPVLPIMRGSASARPGPDSSRGGRDGTHQRLRSGPGPRGGPPAVPRESGAPWRI